MPEAGERREQSGQRRESNKSLDLHCHFTPFPLRVDARCLVTVEVPEAGKRRQESGQSGESNESLDLHGLPP